MNEAVLTQLLQMAPKSPSEIDRTLWLENFRKDYPEPTNDKDSVESFYAFRDACKATIIARYFARTGKEISESKLTRVILADNKHPGWAAWHSWKEECYALYKRDYAVNWAKAQYTSLNLP